MPTSTESLPKSVPNDPQLIEFVTKELKGGAAPADVIYEVCRRAGVEWPEAEAFVRPFAQERQRQRRQKPKPIVGLLIFISIALMVGVAGVVVLKTSLDHRSVDPIIYEAVTPTDSPFRSDWFYRERWAEVGQTILIDYDVSAHSGSLSLYIGEKWSQTTGRGLYDMSRDAQLFTLPQAGRGQLKYPVTDTGWYGLRVFMSDFTGRYEIAWEVR